MIKSLSWTLVGNIIYAASQFGMLIVLSKLGSAEILGEFSFALSVTAPIILLLNFDMRTVICTDTKSNILFSDYLGFRLLTTAVALAAIFSLTLIISTSFESRIVILLIGFSKSCESVSDILCGFMQKNYNMDFVSKSTILKSLSSILGMSMLFALTHNLVMACSGLSIAWLLTLLFYDFPRVKKFLKKPNIIDKHKFNIYPSFDKIKIQQLLKIGLPLGIVTTLVSFNIYIPRYYLNYFVGKSELGIFTSLISLLMVGGIIAASASQVAIPVLANYYAQTRKKDFFKVFTSLILFSLVIGLFLTFISMVWGAELLQLLFGKEYAAYSYLLVRLIVGSTLANMFWFLSSLMTMFNKFYSQLPIFACVQISCIMCCNYLIPIAGIEGAVTSFIVSLVVQCVLMIGAIVPILNDFIKKPIPVG
jgi:O-antigen/teichoic acid export membrane protein